MTPNLPTPDAYYRPARARALRKRAARLEWWSRCLLAQLWFFSLAEPPDVLSKLADKYRRQAARLEAEHGARYGALPAGEED